MLLAAGGWFVIVVLVYLLFVHCFTLLGGCFRFRAVLYTCCLLLDLVGFSLLCVVCIVTVIMYDYSLVVVFITYLCMMMHLFG